MNSHVSYAVKDTATGVWRRLQCLSILHRYCRPRNSAIFYCRGWYFYCAMRRELAWACILVLCDTHDSSILIVDTKATIQYRQSHDIPCKNDWWGRPLLPEIFLSNWPRWSEIADFGSIFACNASVVTHSKNVQLTITGSPLRAFQWAQNEHRTLSLTPKEELKNAVSKIWTVSCDNSETVRDRMSVTINH